MARPVDPQVAIRDIREALGRLEQHLDSTGRGPRSPGGILCSVCHERGHNARRHRTLSSDAAEGEGDGVRG